MPNATLLALILASLLASSAGADLEAAPEADVPHEDRLSGRAIYDRVLAHRLEAFYLEGELVNGNGEGDARRMRFVMLWQDFGKDGGELLSKTRIEFVWPFDLRFGGVLIEKKRDKPAQQWAYIPELRRSPRVSLRGVPIHGSAFTFDDIVPPEADDFRYRRLDDDVFEGEPVFVLELFPRPNTVAEHSRIVVSIDKARDVVLRTRYFDAGGRETKELALPPAELEQFDRSWFPMLARMRSLEGGAFSTIRATRFVANPELDRASFDLGRLESH